jgi:hypothetical protein
MANYGGALELFRAVSVRHDGFVSEGSSLCLRNVCQEYQEAKAGAFAYVCQEAKAGAFAYVGLPRLILDLTERRRCDFYSSSLFRI